MNCIFCEKECKTLQAKKSHERLCKLNPNRCVINKKFWDKVHNGTASVWNKGKTKETDERIALYSESISRTLLQHNPWKGKHHTNETKEKLAKSGGYRCGSGYGKHGTYKGYYCDSSWELAFVVYNIEHGIEFNRNRKTFPYKFEGKTRKYMPDWIMNGEYVEIKGYWSEQWEAKLKQFPKDETLRVLTEKEIKPYLDYVIEKYGKDFVKLYA